MAKSNNSCHASNSAPISLRKIYGVFLALAIALRTMFPSFSENDTLPEERSPGYDTFNKYATNNGEWLKDFSLVSILYPILRFTASIWILCHFNLERSCFAAIILKYSSTVLSNEIKKYPVWVPAWPPPPPSDVSRFHKREQMFWLSATCLWIRSSHWYNTWVHKARYFITFYILIKDIAAGLILSWAGSLVILLQPAHPSTTCSNYLNPM